eukprot:193391_1
MAGKGKQQLSRLQLSKKQPPSGKGSDTTPKKPQITFEQVQLKRKLKKNQALEDLNKAENLVLDLLNVCSDTSHRFAELSTGEDYDAVESKSMTTSGERIKSESSTNNYTTDSSSTASTRSRHWDEISKNGTLFQERIKHIHELLVPHSKLIVNYTYRENDADVDITNKNDKVKQSSNMYESRMEMKLAIERRNLLQNLLELEASEEKQSDQISSSCEKIETSVKRKRED